MALLIYLSQSTVLLYQTKVSRRRFTLDFWFSIDHNINTSKYNSLAGSSYIKLPEELHHPRKGLGNTQNINDNECFK